MNAFPFISKLHQAIWLAAAAALAFSPLQAQNTHSAQLIRAQQQSFTAADSPSLNFGNGSLTGEAWVKVNAGAADTQDMVILEKRTSGDTAYMLYLANGGNLYAEVGNGSSAQAAQTVQIDDGNWHHIAFTYDQTTLRLYLDGVERAAQPVSGRELSSSSPLFIGRSALSNTLHFDGFIDEVRLWNVARSQAQIQAEKTLLPVGSEAGLRAYWNFNGTVFDQTTNSNLLTSSNSPAYSTAQVPFVYPIPDYPDFQVLESGLSTPGNLQIDGDTLYYLDNGNIRRLPVTGGTSTLVASPGAGRFTVVDNDLVGHYGNYTSMTVYRVPKLGGSLVNLAGGSGGVFLGIIGNQAHFMTGFSKLYRVPLSGGEGQYLVDCGFARDSVWDAGSIFYHEYDSQSLKRYVASTNTIETLLPNDGGDGYLFLDADYLYFSRANTTRRIPKAGGPAVTIINESSSQGWAADGINVFYVRSGNLRSIPRGGGSFNTLASFASRTIGTVALDHGYVYLGDSGSGGGRIVRVAKSPSIGVVDIETASYSISETGGVLNVRLKRWVGASGPATVQISTQTGSAGPEDFIAIQQTATFADGESTKTVPISITNDDQIEADETFQLVLSSPSYAFRLGNTKTATVTIINDDVDTDGDSMLDAWELTHGLNKDVDDRHLDLEGDGLANFIEWQFRSRPDLTDTNSDGVSDYQSYITGRNPVSLDSDGDGIPDAWELGNGFNPLVNDAALDHDGDGLTNAEEFTAGLNPRQRDSNTDGTSDYAQVKGTKFNRYYYDRTNRLTGAVYDNGTWMGWKYDGNSNIARQTVYTGFDADNDGLPDVWELQNGLSFASGTGSNGPAADNDNDGWSNQQEFLASTNPNSLISIPTVPTGAASYQSAPLVRLILPPASGGAHAKLKARVWDNEANPAALKLEYFHTASSEWRTATLLKLDNLPVTPTTKATSTAAGSTHDLLWNALADLGPAHNAVTYLRIQGTDFNTGAVSETTPYALNTTGDFDGDGIPDTWELANNLDPNNATGPQGAAADLDHDGLNTFGEYVFGLNLAASDARDVTTTATAINPADGKRYFTLTYRKRLDAAANGLTYNVQTSSNLIDWTSNGPDVEAVSQVPSGDGVTELITVRIKPPLDDTGVRKFVQVRVSK